MTLEQRMVIEPADIASVEFECPKCKSRFVRDFGKESEVPVACPSQRCGQKFFLEFDEGPEELRKALNTLQKYAKEPNHRPFTLRFEIKQAGK